MLGIPIDDPNSVEYMADWVELSVVLEAGISKAEVSSTIERWKGDGPAEEFIDSVWMELKRRLPFYGENPPFEVRARSVRSLIEWQKNPEYLMCLILVMLGNADRPVETGKLFERLGGEAIQKYVGGDAIIFGYPARDMKDIESIASRLHERYNYSPPGEWKDLGVDVIAWKPFGDERPSQIVILVQCAAGFNWKSKLHDVPIVPWQGYIIWGCNPLPAFIVPCLISREDFFLDYGRHSGIFIDRPRIYRNTFAIELEDDLRARIKEWCDKKLPELIDGA